MILCMIGTMALVKLQDIRQRKVLSRRELAERAEISLGALIKIELGRVKRPQTRVIRAIAAALEVEPAEVDEFKATLGIKQ